jgi:hypothetical protein
MEGSNTGAWVLLLILAGVGGVGFWVSTHSKSGGCPSCGGGCPACGK